MSCCQSDHGLKSTHCYGYRYFALIEVQSFSPQSTVVLSCILDAILLNLGGTLSLGKGDVLLKEVASKYWHLSIDMLLSTTTSSGCSDKCRRLLVDLTSATTIVLLVICNIGFNDYFILIEEVELNSLMTTRRLVSVISDNSLCDLPIMLGILLIQHHE